jgi:hypothetical protein
VTRVDDGSNLTLEVLRDIRETLREANQCIDRHREENRTDFGRLRSEMNQRLDHLGEGQIRLATDVTGLREDVGGLREDVRVQARRLDNVLTTGGSLVQDLRGRVERLEDHEGLDPQS